MARPRCRAAHSIGAPGGNAGPPGDHLATRRARRLAERVRCRPPVAFAEHSRTDPASPDRSKGHSLEGRRVRSKPSVHTAWDDLWADKPDSRPSVAFATVTQSPVRARRPPPWNQPARTRSVS